MGAQSLLNQWWGFMTPHSVPWVNKMISSREVRYSWKNRFIMVYSHLLSFWHLHFLMHETGPPVQPQKTPTRGYRNIGYLSECYIKLKSREISLLHTITISSPIVLKICTEDGIDIAVLYINFQNDLTTEQWVVGKRDFATSKFAMRFGRYPILPHPPSGCVADACWWRGHQKTITYTVGYGPC